MRPFGIAMVEVGTHDPKRQVPFDRLIKGRTPEPAAKRPLSGDEKGTSKERPDRRSRDREAGRVSDRLRQLHVRKRFEFRRDNFSDERDILRRQTLPRSRTFRNGPKRVEVHLLSAR